MEDKNFYYGIIIKGSIVKVEELTFETVDQEDYDFALVGINDVDYKGNGHYNIVIRKNQKEVDGVEINSWVISGGIFAYDWGNSVLSVSAKDENGISESIRLYADKGSAGGFDLQEMITYGFQELVRITKRYNTLDMYKVCEKTVIDCASKTELNLNEYMIFANSSFSFLDKVSKTKIRLENNKIFPKDLEAYNSKLKPRIQAVMSKLTEEKLLQSVFDLK